MNCERLLLRAAVAVICAGAVQAFGGNARSGQGKMTVSPSVVVVAGSNNFTFTFRSPNSGNYNPGSQATFQVPAGWVAPQTNSASAAGFIGVTPVLSQTLVSIGSISGSGPWTITIDFSTVQRGSGFNLNYANVIAPTNAGVYSFPVQTRQSGGMWSRLKSGSPTVTVNDTNRINTSTTVTSSTNPSVYGQTVTFTASVTPQATGTLSGTILFMDGDVVLGTAALDGAGQAALSTSALSVVDAPHSILAEYSGNATFNGSISIDLSQDVTQAPLTVSGVVANNKIYDGTTAASLDSSGAVLVGGMAGDDVTLDASGAAGSFADRNVGSVKTVTVSGLALSGADAMNYVLLEPSATASITARPLAVGAAGVNKIYDGTTSATVTLWDDRVAGDDLTTGYSAAAFADQNVGTGKLVSVSGISATGPDAGNYALASTTATTTASIFPAQAPDIAIRLNPDGGVDLECSGAPGGVFMIQAATELTGPWSVISTNIIGANGICSIGDVDAPNFPTRFYRAMISY